MTSTARGSRSGPQGHALDSRGTRKAGERDGKGQLRSWLRRPSRRLVEARQEGSDRPRLRSPTRALKNECSFRFLCSSEREPRQAFFRWMAPPTNERLRPCVTVDTATLKSAILSWPAIVGRRCVPRSRPHRRATRPVSTHLSSLASRAAVWSGRALRAPSTPDGPRVTRGLLRAPPTSAHETD